MRLGNLKLTLEFVSKKQDNLEPELPKKAKLIILLMNDDMSFLKKIENEMICFS